MKDDRAEFEAERERNALLLGQQRDLAHDALNILLRAERYRYSYLWTWMGVPIIQMPSDIIATQEIIWRTRPDIIVETGVARGGSVIFYASILPLIGGHGRVIGIDIDIRAHNRDTIEQHPMSERITLVEGSSTAPETVEKVKALIPDGSKTMVVLDSDHSKSHVLSELEALGPLVTPGQYLIVADTALGELTPDQTPTDRAAMWYPGDEPLSALREYMTRNDLFVLDEEINGKMLFSNSPGGYVRRVG